jgi:hypothetical protein
MSHFAKIDNNNVVTELLVAEQDFINTGAVGDPFRWVQTSYNNNFRKQYASIGMTYDRIKDKFISPKPFASFTLDDNDDWQPPVNYPADGTFEKQYEWDEDTTSWKEIE